jgi:ribosomal protein S12 methylthiotransferase
MRYFLDSFGCAKNQVDAESMMAVLNGAGWTASDNADGADLIIVNSCAFIEDAKRESINAVLLWKKHCPGKKILLAGCLAQRYGAELAESLPEADGLFGNSSLSGAADAAARAAGIAPSGAGARGSEAGSRPLLGFPGLAYVKISEGCDNRCSFCAIPLIRGPLRCRPAGGITGECAALLARGVKELCVIGQDIAAYRDPSAPDQNGRPALARLAAALAELSGDFRVRFLYLHPDHFPLELLDVMRENRRLLPYFDIPFQHAAPNILRAMNRRGGADSYLRLLDTIRGALPDAVIRSTFLTGFPGETEADFAALLDFQEKARFDWLGVFTFSREEGTPAYSMPEKVPKRTAARRKAMIEERQVSITEERMNRFVGRRLDALIEEAVDDTDGGLWLGRLYCHAPEVDGCAVIRAPAGGPPLEPGNMIPCTVVGRAGFDLETEAG